MSIEINDLLSNEIEDIHIEDIMKIPIVKGEKGDKGDKGDKPVAGIDYFTETEKIEFKNEVIENSKKEIEIHTTDKIKEYDDNATSKTDIFNSNATNKTTEYNYNANEKLMQYNNNVTSKMEEYNLNASCKVNEYNQNAENLINRLIETESENKRLRDDLNGLPSGQATGEIINVEDSAEMRFNELKISGNSRQKTRSGKNIYNVNSVNYATNTVTKDNDDYITMSYDNTSGTASGFVEYHSNLLNVQTGHTYTIVVETKSVSGTGTLRINSLVNGNGESQFNLTEIDSSQLKNGKVVIVKATTIDDFTDIKKGLRTNIIVKPGQSFSVVFRISVIDDASITTDNFKYEQYGASPSPDYPSEVKCCGDNGNINVVIGNKNLLDVSILDNYSTKGITLTKNEGTNKVKLNGTSTDLFTIYSKDLDIKRFKIGEKYTLSKDFNNIAFNFEVFENNSDTASIWSTSIIMKESYTRIRIYLQGKSNITFNNQEIALQLEKGNATEIVEHKTQEYTIPTQQPMRAIGDIRDTFIKKNNKWYERHYITRLILDGTETWELESVGRFGIIRSKLPKIPKPAANNGTYIGNMCNYYKESTPSLTWVKTQGFCIDISSCLRIYDNTYSSNNDLEGFKTWLSEKYNAGTPVYVDYILETPIDLECTEEQSTILFDIEQNAKTYKNITHIYSTDEIGPNIEVTYKKDIDTIITNIEQAILSQGGNI